MPCSLVCSESRTGDLQGGIVRLYLVSAVMLTTGFVRLMYDCTTMHQTGKTRSDTEISYTQTLGYLVRIDPIGRRFCRRSTKGKIGFCAKRMCKSLCIQRCVRVSVSNAGRILWIPSLLGGFCGYLTDKTNTRKTWIA